MANIIPQKVEYDLVVLNHTMRAVAEHLELARKITFYFDDKVVSEKAVPPGDYLSDDDLISELVENYCKSQNGVYADIFRRHSDKVHLVSKKLEFLIENYGIKMAATVIIEKNIYRIHVDGNNGDDTFSCIFRAVNFSEVLEKVRVFTNTIEGISDSLSMHISELATDKVEQWIKWE